MKKYFKICLILGVSIIVVGGVRAGLTRVGIIPNWFEIEVLCPDQKRYNDVNDYLCEKYNDKNVCDSNVTCEKVDTYTYSCCLMDGLCFYYMDYPNEVKKPIIYLYPTKEAEIKVTLGKSENLLHTYPKYDSSRGRNVIAQPNGDLEDIETGKKLYALYREGNSSIGTNFTEGFVVAGKDVISFLEEKLAILGLNEREAEEFIVYWLPQMENNKYNLIRFETIEEQDKNMPLNITPKPDTMIRVMMNWKVIDEPIDIPEQQLTTPKRNGFIVVEWGGSYKN